MNTLRPSDVGTPQAGARPDGAVGARATSSSQRTRLLASRAGVLVVLVVVGGVFAMPLVWMISTSLKSDPELYANPPIWIPRRLVWENYSSAFSYIPYFSYMRNTLIITGLSVIGWLFSCSFVAYGFARLSWRGRNALFIVLLATMILPYQVTMVPTFIIFSKLGWLNTYFPLILPTYFGDAFFIFLLRQFFLTIPLELSDAARIDGCGEIGIYWRIVLPLAKPALATVVIFGFLNSWNNFLGPLIYLNSSTLYTLALGLAQYQQEHTTAWQMLMAASVTMTLPVIAIFFLAQKHFVRGIVLSGIKG